MRFAYRKDIENSFNDSIIHLKCISVYSSIKQHTRAELARERDLFIGSVVRFIFILVAAVVCRSYVRFNWDRMNWGVGRCRLLVRSDCLLRCWCRFGDVCRYISCGWYSHCRWKVNVHILFPGFMLFELIENFRIWNMRCLYFGCRLSF